MKKNLILFIVFVVLLIVAKVIYTKYCESKPNGCKKVKINYEESGLPKEGIDY